MPAVHLQPAKSIRSCSCVQRPVVVCVKVAELEPHTSMLGIQLLVTGDECAATAVRASCSSPAMSQSCGVLLAGSGSCEVMLPAAPCMRVFAAAAES